VTPAKFRYRQGSVMCDCRFERNTTVVDFEVVIFPEATIQGNTQLRLVQELISELIHRMISMRVGNCNGHARFTLRNTTRSCSTWHAAALVPFQAITA
jgi:hypothetical protein